jgi:putative thioredoxin
MMENMLLNTQANDANLIKDSSTKDFMVDVVEASKTVPVLVDFWAPWCGPCKTLGPILEKIVREAKGKIKLVKIDIDQNPDVATQMRVQSIPAVFAFVDGRPVDGFMGALPESQIKQFISKLGKMGGRAEQIAEAIAMANEALTTNDFAGAADIAAQVLTVDPSQGEAYAIKARAEIALEQLPEAEATLTSAPPELATNPHLISAQAALDLALNPVDTSAVTKLQSTLAANPNDYASRLELAIVLNGAGERMSAIDELIYVIKKDRTWNDDGARKQLVTFFEAWGPKDEATLAGRRKLSAVLFS